MLSSKVTPLRMRNDYDYDLLGAPGIMQLHSLTYMVSTKRSMIQSSADVTQIPVLDMLAYLKVEEKNQLIYIRNIL